MPPPTMRPTMISLAWLPNRAPARMVANVLAALALSSSGRSLAVSFVGGSLLVDGIVPNAGTVTVTK
jgi:hypothetical protein